MVVSIRDATISHKGKIKSHCQSNTTAEKENHAAYDLIFEALVKYGKGGSMLGPADKERVIAVNYEGLMGLKEPYLYNLYSQLGINSTYVPTLSDGNVKYVVDPVEVNPMYHLAEQKIKQFVGRPPKPASLPPPPKHEFFLPKRLITVFSLDSSRFLPTSIAVAVGAFPEGGQWVDQNDALIYQDTMKQSVRSPDGEVAVQHIILPVSTASCDSGAAPVVQALAPSECLLDVDAAKLTDPSIADQCKDEVFISEQNDVDGAKWTCGASCGSGEYDGYAMYPSRYFVNISSHV